jgi:hypothetical protein
MTLFQVGSRAQRGDIEGHAVSLRILCCEFLPGNNNKQCILCCRYSSAAWTRSVSTRVRAGGRKVSLHLDNNRVPNSHVTMVETEPLDLKTKAQPLFWLDVRPLTSSLLKHDLKDLLPVCGAACHAIGAIDQRSSTRSMSNPRNPGIGAVIMPL